MQYEVVVRYTEHAQIKAHVDVVVNDSLCLTGFKVVETDNGLHIVMPQKQEQGIYRNTCFTLNKATQQDLETAIWAAYHNH